MSFYITLPSDSSTKYFPKNTTSKFRTYLPEIVKLNGPYEVALTEISYPRTWNNVKEDTAIRILETDDNANEKGVIIPIPKGSFFTIDDLLEMLQNKNILFKYEKRLKRVTISSRNDLKSIASGHKFKVDIPGDIAVMLGFTLDQNENLVITENAIAPYMVDMDVGLHSLFIYSDVVKNTIVGDSNVPLLRIVSAKGKDGETVDVDFSRPHYLPVASSEIQTIEVNIMDELGNPVQFERGKVHLTLHFKPRRAWLAL